MAHKRWYGMAGLALAASLVLAGCGGGSSTPSSSGSKTSSAASSSKTSSSSSSASSSAPSSSNSSSTHANAIVNALPPGTDLNWWFPIMPANACSDYNAWNNDLMYVPLIYISPQDKIDYSQSLASSITPNSSGTVYDIKLNPKWQWSDGTPVTASDLQFMWNLDIHTANSKSALANCYTGIGGLPDQWGTMTIVNAHEVQVHLKSSVNPAWFEYNGLAQLMPVPKAQWDKYPNDWTKEINYVNSMGNKPTDPVYNVVDGPFKVSSIQRKQAYTYVPNPNYDGHKATIDKFVLQYFASDSAEYAALKTGAVQVGYLPAADYPNGKVSGYNLFTNALFGMFYTYINYSPKSPSGLSSDFKQLYLRQALAYGIDQNGEIQSIFHGLGEPQYTVIPKDPPTQWYSPSLNKNPYPFDVSKGKSLLTSHGWKMVNGVMEKGGKKLALQVIYPSGNTSVDQQMQYEKANWAKEGIQVTLTKQPFAQFLKTLNDPSKWDLAAGSGWTYQPDYYPSGDGLFTPGGYANQGGYVDSKLNALIKKTTQPGSLAATKQAMFAYEDYMAKNIPVLWDFNPLAANEVASYVSGVKSTLNPITYGITPQFWTVNTGG